MKAIKNFFLTTSAILTFAFANAQSADEIISKHIDAVGGKDKIGSITSLYVESTAEAMGNQAPTTTTILNGKGYKSESEMMGSKMTMVITNTGGWAINPMSGGSAAALPEDAYKGEEERIYVDELYNYALHGNLVELQGQEKSGDVNYYKIKLTNKDKHTITYYIDPTTYYITKKVKTMNIMGQEAEVTTTFSDFKKADAGLVIPYTTEMAFGSQFSMTSKVKNAVVNKAIDATIFNMPK